MHFELRTQGRTRIMEVDDARLIFKNFSGKGDKYNREGDRNFAVIIPDAEIAEHLQNDVNEDGVGWNVKISDPKEPGDDPFMFLKVKIRFSDYGPDVYLISGRNRIKLTEDNIGCLDSIDIASVDLDIRAWDNFTNGKFHRTAYLSRMEVVQNVDRFTARWEANNGREEY